MLFNPKNSKLKTTEFIFLERLQKVMGESLERNTS